MNNSKFPKHLLFWKELFAINFSQLFLLHKKVKYFFIPIISSLEVNLLWDFILFDDLIYKISIVLNRQCLQKVLIKYTGPQNIYIIYTAEKYHTRVLFCVFLLFRYEIIKQSTKLKNISTVFWAENLNTY